MSWTDERVETLKKLWSEGLSASQIAGELGGVTRNAVIGKVHRLGLSGRAKSPSSAAPRPRKPRTHGHVLRVSRPSVRGNTALAHAYDLEFEAEPELAGDLTRRQSLGPKLLQRLDALVSPAHAFIPRLAPRRRSPDRIRLGLGNDLLAQTHTFSATMY